MSERTLAHTLLHDIHSATPGGISERMFKPARPSWLLLAIWTALGVLFFVGALAWITR